MRPGAPGVGSCQASMSNRLFGTSVIASAPLVSSSQYSSTLAAPGKRHDMPTTATGPALNSPMVLLPFEVMVGVSGQPGGPRGDRQYGRGDGPARRAADQQHPVADGEFPRADQMVERHDVVARPHVPDGAADLPRRARHGDAERLQEVAFNEPPGAVDVDEPGDVVEGHAGVVHRLL